MLRHLCKNRHVFCKCKYCRIWTNDLLELLRNPQDGWPHPQWQEVCQDCRTSRVVEGKCLYLQEHRENRRPSGRLPLRWYQGSVGVQVEEPDEAFVKCRHFRIGEKVPGSQTILHDGKCEKMAESNSTLEINNWTSEMWRINPMPPPSIQLTCQKLYNVHKVI